MRFLIVRTCNGTVVEEHNDKHIADRICADLNSEETLYQVQPTCPSCYSDDVTNTVDTTWVCEDCGHKMRIK